MNIAIAIFSYASFQVLAGYGARRVSDLAFLVIGSTSLFIFTLVAWLIQTQQGKKLGELDTKGMIFVTLANLAITIFSLYLSRSFQDYPSSFVIPIVFGGAILLSTIVAFILNSYTPTSYEVLSILMISGGLILLGTQSK